MHIRRFTIQPRVPERLRALEGLARNLWWSWNTDAITLFRRLDADLFSATGHNPVRMLGIIDQSRLETLCDDQGFLNHMNRVDVTFQTYLYGPSWYKEKHGEAPSPRIAYFSAEFGLHESLPIYSGGLGVLAGDHLKSASDLGLPLAAVGLLYQQGYFRQYLNADGWQQERYPENDFYNLPCELMRGKDGEPVIVAVDLPSRKVHLQIWRVSIGRISLYLLDANLARNSNDDRQITAQLYGGDHEMRIKQEVVLGIGGMRALKALGIVPTVCHMNEGHSAFLAIERIATIMEEQQLDFETARQLVAAGNVFTTHTPVEAGNDMFPPYLVENYMAPFFQRLKLDRDAFLGLGRQRPEDKSEPFCMTVLAIRLANFVNGVSKLHGKVSRRMWRHIWPELPDEEVPIESITNGIHVRSFLGGEMTQLFDRYLGPDWDERFGDAESWERIEHVPDAEIWRTHERRRDRLVAFARRRVAQQMRGRGAPPNEIAFAEEVLDPDALTIGFARRFATYKRGSLIFRDPERLAKILNDPKRPVQLIFAGKAHPRDHGGKEFIAQIVHMARRAEFRHKVVFIEDYDMNVARFLVQGVDVWLNNPRRPLEASGTSGMKAAVNGVLNLSILDGWWCEGFDFDNGFAIGGGEEYSDLHYQDEVESRALYDLLEKEVVPTFYDRANQGLPRQWIQRMKRSIHKIGPVFNTHRMVREYAERFYLPSQARFELFQKDKFAAAGGLARWLRQVEHEWRNVRIEEVKADAVDPLQVGASLKVAVKLRLGKLKPEDVRVELYHGELDALGGLVSATTASMAVNGHGHAGDLYTFEGAIDCRASGQHGYAVRVAPRHGHLPRRFQPGLVRWG